MTRSQGIGSPRRRTKALEDGRGTLLQSTDIPAEVATHGSGREDHIHIRWHGRGGQGAVTSAKILADAAFHSDSPA